jgi:hypothetical protein
MDDFLWTQYTRKLAEGFKILPFLPAWLFTHFQEPFIIVSSPMAHATIVPNSQWVVLEV